MVEINIAHKTYSEALENIWEQITDTNNIHCRISFSADHSQSKIIRDFVGMIFDAQKIHIPWR